MKQTKLCPLHIKTNSSFSLLQQAKFCRLETWLHHDNFLWKTEMQHPTGEQMEKPQCSFYTMPARDYFNFWYKYFPGRGQNQVIAMVQHFVPKALALAGSWRTKKRRSWKVKLSPTKQTSWNVKVCLDKSDKTSCVCVCVLLLWQIDFCKQK